MIIVSDTTALSNLIQINKLQLLQHLYSEVIIPTSVYDELYVLVDLEIITKEILDQDWIIIRSVKNTEQVNDLLKVLDIGESEAIILAQELKADYLLIDEKEGRLIATKKRMKIIGTLGILLKAKQKNLIKSVVEEMDKLRQIGFWINDSLYLKITELEKKL
ncbi:MAG: DUF3368 domain-containing protein [Chitinophagales bacterium]|nr:DUF3368 domain-containing protein [Chitinophagales bacterium]